MGGVVEVRFVVESEGGGVGGVTLIWEMVVGDKT